MSEAATTAAPAKKGSTAKLIVIVAAAVAVVGAGGAGGAWYFLGRNAHHAEAKVEEKKPPKKTLFTTLEPFTVNLQDPRGERFAQIGITLEYEDPAIETQIKDRLPAVRNDILLLISSKQIEELLSTKGKQELADQIREHTVRSLGVEVAKPAHGAASTTVVADAGPIRGVLFSQFIVQ